MLSHKIDFNCCANRDGFRRDSHIYGLRIKSIKPFMSLKVLNMISSCVGMDRTMYTIGVSNPGALYTPL